MGGRSGQRTPAYTGDVLRFTVLNRLITSRMAERGIPGLALAVVRQGEPLDVRAYGRARLDSDSALVPESVFDIASVSKTFLATLVMQLIEEGVFSLETRIVDYVSGLPNTWQHVRIEHALRHRSGIRDYCTVPAYWQQCAAHKSGRDLLTLVASLPLGFEPGDRWAYDNTGFLLLWMLLETATGQTYAELLKARILAPLDMQRTCVHQLRVDVPDRVMGTIPEKGEPVAAGPYSPSNVPYNLLSSVTDLVKWDQAFLGNRMVNPSTRDLMWTPQLSPAANERDMGFTMGLGWFIAASPLG